MTGGDTGYDSLTMTNTQPATQAHIQVDNIDIFSDSNTFDEAIAGVSLDILKKDASVSTTLSVNTDPDATKTKIKEFSSAYNDVINFIAEQSDADWGNDASFRSVKRNIQDLLSKTLTTGGSYSALSQIGFETQRDGTLVVNDTMLSDALSGDFEGVVGLFAGDGTTSGASQLFIDYLDGMTDSVAGLLSTKKESTDSTTKRIDSRIDSLELRMESRERVLRAQFSAMENLVSSLSNQGSYLAQQMASMPTIGSKN